MVKRIKSTDRITLRRQRIAVAMLGAVIAIGVTGCANGASSAFSNDDATASGISPLQEFTSRLGRLAPDATPEENVDYLVSQQRNRENLIARCMHDQGFTYYPNVRVPTLTIVADETGSWGTREFAEQFGFGISEDLNGPGFGLEYSGHVDPNGALLEAMSPEEQAAWSRALWGNLQDGQWDANAAGCSGAAVNALNRPAEFALISLRLEDFGRAMDTAPALLALDEEWSQCMNQAGFPDLSKPHETQNALREEWAILQGRTPLGGGSFEGRPQRVDPVEQAAFLQREVAMALASWDCQVELNIEERARQIRFDLEQEFVDKNRAELELWAIHMEELAATP